VPMRRGFLMVALALCGALVEATRLTRSPSALPIGRRAALSSLAVLSSQASVSSLAVLSGQASAVDKPGAELQLHKDREYGDNFLVPSGWAASENELSGGRKLVAFADPGDSDSNIFILWTPLAADYTSLGSFGNINYVSSTFLPTCGSDRSACTLAADGIEGRLLESVAVRGSYVYDYVIEQAAQPTRHLRTLVTVALEEGRGKQLVTLTAQCRESKHAELSQMLAKVIDSYKPS